MKENIIKFMIRDIPTNTWYELHEYHAEKQEAVLYSPNYGYTTQTLNNLADPRIEESHMKNVSPELWKVIQKVAQKCPTAVFGGSIALNAVGLINRPIKDIDVFFYENESKEKNGYLSLKGVESQVTSDTVTDMNGKKIQRTGIIVDGIHVCAFSVPSEQMLHAVMNFEGLKLRIQNINYAIQAKLIYTSKTPKHKEDMEAIKTTLSTIDAEITDDFKQPFVPSDDSISDDCPF